MRQDLKVGVFDSGIGGLTVLSACARRLPATYYYWGDNARAPYGSRTPEEILSFVREAMRAFEGLEVDAAVLACNTATAVAVDRIRREFSFPVIGMEPAVRSAAEGGGEVLVLATPRTAESERLKKLISRFPACRFRVEGLPDLARAVEERMRGRPLTISDHLPRGKFDGVVLGCTHYVYLREEIAHFYGCPVYDGNEGTAKRLEFCLSRLKERGGTDMIGTDDHLFLPINTNDCSEKTGENCRKNVIFFLGSGKKVNFQVYKQMFAIHEGL